MFNQVNAVPKPKHKRGKKTAKQRGQVSKAIYAEAWERSGGRCEMCGRGAWEAWTLEAAHVERRWKSRQEGVTAADIIILCGPSTDSRTCHHIADYKRTGREWLVRKREEIKRRKSNGDRFER